MVKTAFLFIISFFFLVNGHAQETVLKKHWLTDSVQERYFVLKSDRVTRQGLYQAIYNRLHAVASGQFVHNRKVGMWHYYDTNGKLLQNFNYDKNTLEYEAPTDTSKTIRYVIDHAFTDSDRITLPVKIGGRFYGYIPLLKAFKLPADFYGIDMSDFEAVVDLLISPLGRLADYKVRLTSKRYAYDRTIPLSIDQLNNEDKIFFPASFNGKGIACQVLIRCYFTAGNELDFD